MTELRRELESFGLAPRRLVLLDRASPTNVDYLDLVSESTSAAPDIGIEAVLPGLHGPTLYLLREDRLGLAQSGQSSVVPLLRKLACRGEDALLAVFKPGLVDVYPVGFSTQAPLPHGYPRTIDGLRPLFVDMEAGDPVGAHDGGQHDSARRAVHALLFSLIQGVTQQLRKTRLLRDNPDVLFALVGRALFARFLVDRRVMTAEHGPRLPGGVGLVDCFSTPRSAARTCEWLDRVFNGDLLPLWDGRYAIGFQQLHELSPKALGVLSNLVRREPNGQMTFDDLWGDLDFGHIPTGLLSEVYEHYAHDVFPDHAARESVHYTPRGIARLIVDEAFEGLGMDEIDRARVLDPAAGAGVFLVLAYRRLITERWRRRGRRLSSGELRRVLAEQLCGLDINSYALKLAALSLYLTVLELDPTEEPSKRLSFKPLFGSVLRSTRAIDEQFPSPHPVAGSLGSEVPRALDGTFDLVIGNPPWTAWSPGTSRGRRDAVARLNDVATEITQRVAMQRLPEGLHEDLNGYKNPDNVPDLPFVWRAMEWLRPGGALALVVHARLLFKRSKVGTDARNLLFRCLRFTGIINGSDLAGTCVWPSVNAPFAILFAKNETPRWPDGFHFINPYRDPRPATGRVRIDAHDATLVQQQIVIERPQVLKVLYRGGGLDSDILERIEALEYPTLVQYWQSELGLRSGKGLQTTSDSQNARDILDLPYLTTEFKGRFIVDSTKLPRFRKPRVHRIRDPLIYKGPMVVFREAALEDQSRRALLCFEDCVFNESFIGYSAHGSVNEAKDLSAYLLVLGLSNFPLYWSLMTSAKFGVGRKVFQVEDLDALPIKRLAQFRDDERHALRQLAEALQAGRCDSEKIDRFVFGLYGLSTVDREVIRDTLETRAPYGSAHKLAAAPPTQQTVEAFARRMESVLHPFFASTQDRVTVSHVAGRQTAWRFLRVSMNNMMQGPELPTGMLTALGDATGASVVRYVASPGEVYLAILAQGRYWTQTRARTLAVSLLRSGETLFPIADDLEVSAG